MPRTPVTVIGNVVNSPSRVRLPSGDSVTNFRVASTERRFDSERQAYIDSSTFFVDVECWGELGGNVSHTVSKGDPVVVFGALRTDEWEGEQGRRSKSKVRADAVGLNLSWGVAEFKRARRTAAPDEPASAAEEPAEEGYAASGHGEEAAIQAGEDYVVTPATLDSLDPDLAVPEPALH